VLVLFVYGFAIVCTVILAMAFFLELFNANEATPFVRWVFRATDRIMQPFRGIFPAIEGESGSLFDPALLFAMFMYWLLALGMHALIGWTAAPPLGAHAAPTPPGGHGPSADVQARLARRRRRGVPIPRRSSSGSNTRKTCAVVSASSRA
jgi:uncharacterized protein YggT (Ycf19 family)